MTAPLALVSLLLLLASAPAAAQQPSRTPQATAPSSPGALPTAPSRPAPAPPSASKERQWVVDVIGEKDDGARQMEAYIFTADGHHFRIFRRDDRSVWAELRLPRASEDRMTARYLPVYQVDDNPPHDLESLKQLEIGSKPQLYNVVDRTAAFLLWAGAEPGVVPQPLRELMLGDKLHITYRNRQGRERRVTLPLARANEAIARFLGVEPLEKTDTTGGNPNLAFRDLAKAHLERCELIQMWGGEDDFHACKRRFTMCSETPGQTPESYAACLAGDAAGAAASAGAPAKN